MLKLEDVKSPYHYTVCLSANANLNPVIEQIEVVNKTSREFGFQPVIFNPETRTITIDYEEKNPCEAGDGLKFLECSYKNTAMVKAIYKLVCLCNILTGTPEVTLLDGRKLKVNPITHIDAPIETDQGTFYKNTNFFLSHSEEILNDSRLFFTPVYSRDSCFFGNRPTLGVFIEFWNECRRKSIVENDLPICGIVGNPQTGSHGCTAQTPGGELVKPNLRVPFTELLTIFGRINSRYNHLRDVCQSYTLQEAIEHFNMLSIL